MLHRNAVKAWILREATERKLQAPARPELIHTEASYSVAQVFIYNQSSMQYFHHVSAVKLVNTNTFMFKTKVLSLAFIDM